MGGVVAGKTGPSFLFTLPLEGCGDVVVDGCGPACLSCGTNATSLCCGMALVRAGAVGCVAALGAVRVRFVVG